MFFTVFALYYSQEVFYKSKLYNKYIQLKKDCPEKLYLFKSGIFYISLDEDAKNFLKYFNLK